MALPSLGKKETMRKCQKKGNIGLITTTISMKHVGL